MMNNIDALNVSKNPQFKQAFKESDLPQAKELKLAQSSSDEFSRSVTANHRKDSVKQEEEIASSSLAPARKEEDKTSLFVAIGSGIIALASLGATLYLGRKHGNELETQKTKLLASETASKNAETLVAKLKAEVAVLKESLSAMKASNSHTPPIHPSNTVPSVTKWQEWESAKNRFHDGKKEGETMKNYLDGVKNSIDEFIPVMLRENHEAADSLCYFTNTVGRLCLLLSKFSVYQDPVLIGAKDLFPENHAVIEALQKDPENLQLALEYIKKQFEKFDALLQTN